MNRPRTLLALAVATTAALALAQSAPATFTLGEGPATPIAPLAINGFNSSWNMPIVEAIEPVRSVAPSSIRFPGGNVGDENDLTKAGLNYLKSSLSLTGTDTAAIVQTRAFSTRDDARNKPEDAAQAARDAKELGLEVAYWEVGNEPDLYATNRGDPSWTPQKYCRVFREQRQAILQVDPNAKFAGPATSKGVQNPKADEFFRGFLKECGDIVDLLTWHEYPSQGELSDEAALASVSNVSDSIRTYQQLVKDPQANPKGHQRDIQLGVTEYGLSWKSNNPRHLADQVSALWSAETALRLAEAGIDVTSYFALIGAGGHGLVDLAGVPRPTLYAFQQLRHFKGEALPVQSSDPALWAHAARDGDRLTLLVSNTATDPRTVRTELPGYQLIGGKTFTEETVTNEDDFIKLRLAPSVELPGRSLTRLAYKRTNP